MNDSINRQAAIDAIWSHATNILESSDYDVLFQDIYKMAHRHIAELIEQLPPAQQWIPVSERLPEDGEYVLVCADKIKSAFGPEDCRFLWRWISGYSEKRVSAWMPLPEPFKEVE